MRRIKTKSPAWRRPTFSSLVRILFFFIFGAMVVTGCSTTKDIKLKGVELCENQHCSSIPPRAVGKEEVFLRISDLLNESKNVDIPLFTIDPEKRGPEKPNVKFFIQGGFMPAFCDFESVRITDVLQMDRQNLEMKFLILPKATYLGIPVLFATGEGTLTVKSLTEIRLTFKNLATWLVVGTSGWQIDWLIDYIDLNRKVLGSYYAISGGGPMCAGGGSGYQVAHFGRKEAGNETMEALPTPSPPR